MLHPYKRLSIHGLLFQQRTLSDAGCLFQWVGVELKSFVHRSWDEAGVRCVWAHVAQSICTGIMVEIRSWQGAELSQGVSPEKSAEVFGTESKASADPGRSLLPTFEWGA